MVEEEIDDSGDDIQYQDVHLAKLKPEPHINVLILKLQVNQTLKKKYDFDVTKADQIFDILLKDKQI
jgi:hypothetical protein